MPLQFVLTSLFDPSFCHCQRYVLLQFLKTRKTTSTSREFQFSSYILWVAFFYATWCYPFLPIPLLDSKFNIQGFGKLLASRGQGSRLKMGHFLCIQGCRYIPHARGIQGTLTLESCESSMLGNRLIQESASLDSRSSVFLFLSLGFTKSFLSLECSVLKSGISEKCLWILMFECRMHFNSRHLAFSDWTNIVYYL